MIVEITGNSGEFTLEDMGTTGHVWEVEKTDGVVIERIPSAEPAGEADAAFGGKTATRYRATGIGSATMVLRRSWEDGVEPAERAEIVVRE